MRQVGAAPARMPRPQKSRPQQVHRSDPAPSRLKYRLERLMLTPLFRFTLHIGMPFLIGVGGAAAYFSVDSNREAFVGAIMSVRDQIEARPEFRVNLMAIDGASDGVAADVREILSLDFPLSSFDLDLDQMREIITGLDAVKSASLRITQGGVLEVNVVERVPVVLWRGLRGLELLDEGGALVGPAGRRASHADLPVIAGTGAEAHVPEALDLFAAAAPLAGGCAASSGSGCGAGILFWIRGSAFCCPKKAPFRRSKGPWRWTAPWTCCRAISRRSICASRSVRRCG